MKFKAVICILILNAPFHMGWCQDNISGQEADSMVLYSQTETSATIEAIGKSYGDSIVLRWAPSTAGAWYLSNQYGYKIERLELNPGESFDPGLFALIHTDPIKPFSLEETEQLVDKNPANNFLLAAAECIHGEMQSQEMGEGLQDWILRDQELKNRWAFAIFSADMDASAAQAGGLRFVDKNISKGKIYFYRIYSMVPPGKYNIEPSYVTVKAENVESIPTPKFSQVREEEGAVYLEWDRILFERHFSACYIEQSLDGNEFTSLTEIPYVHAQTNDSLLQSPFINFKIKIENYLPRYYRIKGITPFGEISPASNTVYAMAHDRTPPAFPTEVKARHIAGSKMEITWKSGSATDLAGFYISRSFSFSDGYQRIHKDMLPTNSDRFIDDNASEFTTNYYMVEAVDTAGNSAPSIVAFGAVLDSIAPAQPVGLHGTIDTQGIVTLSWIKGKEADLKAYLVYFANASDHVFSQVTSRPLRDTIFQDTIQLNSLTRNIYYKIVALDTWSNCSEFSETLELVKPDLIPPSAPLFTDYKIEKDHIYLKWARSSSNDLNKHILFRKLENEPWIMIAEFSDQTNIFRDSLIQENRTYEYKIQAIDQAGLISDIVNPLRLTAMSSGIKPGISKLICTKLISEQHVQLSWSFPNSDEHRYIIYKAKDGGPFQSCQKLNADQKVWIETSLETGSLYEYTIQVIYPDGSSSKFSEIAKIEM